MGNNYNNRKDLKIYKLPIDQSSKEKTEIISFNYPEQKSFKINRKTIYDAEGLISIDNKLIIFTKNRAKKITELYLIQHLFYSDNKHPYKNHTSLSQAQITIKTLSY